MYFKTTCDFFINHTQNASDLHSNYDTEKETIKIHCFRSNATKP